MSDPKEALERLKAITQPGSDVYVTYGGETYLEPANAFRADLSWLIAEREGLEREVAELKAQVRVAYGFDRDAVFANIDKLTEQRDGALEQYRLTVADLIASDAKLSALSEAAKDVVCAYAMNNAEPLDLADAMRAWVERLSVALLHPTVPVERGPFRRHQCVCGHTWSAPVWPDQLCPACNPSVSVETANALVSEADRGFRVEIASIIAGECFGKHGKDALERLPEASEVMCFAAADEIIALSVAPPSQGMERLAAAVREVEAARTNDAMCFAMDGLLGAARQALAAFQSHKGGEGDSELAAADNNHKADS